MILSRTLTGKLPPSPVPNFPRHTGRTIANGFVAANHTDTQTRAAHVAPTSLVSRRGAQTREIAIDPIAAHPRRNKDYTSASTAATTTTHVNNVCELTGRRVSII